MALQIQHFQNYFLNRIFNYLLNGTQHCFLFKETASFKQQNIFWSYFLNDNHWIISKVSDHCFDQPQMVVKKWWRANVPFINTMAGKSYTQKYYGGQTLHSKILWRAKVTLKNIKVGKNSKDPLQSGIMLQEIIIYKQIWIRNDLQKTWHLKKSQ